MTHGEWVKFVDKQMEVWTANARKNKNILVSIQVEFSTLPLDMMSSYQSLKIFICKWGEETTGDGRKDLVIKDNYYVSFYNDTTKKDAMEKIKKLKTFLKEVSL
jgi:hypothetical protein